MADALDGLAGVDDGTLTDEELAEGVLQSRRLLQRLACLDADLLARFSSSGAWAPEARSVAGWVTQRAHAGAGETRARLRLARFRARHPVMAAAVQAGEVSLDHLRELAAAHHRVPSITRELDAVESVITEYASQATPAELRGFLDELTRNVAPDATDDHDRDRLEDRAHLSVTELLDGWVAVSGVLPPALGGRFLSALRALSQPAATPADSEAHPSDETDPWRIGPQRPAGQRLLDALSRLIDHACDGMAGGQTFPDLRGSKPTVIVTVPLDVLTGTTGGTGSMLTPATARPVPVSAEQARGFACDGVVRRLVLDAGGVPLDAGRRHRTVSSALATAVQQRDGHCRWTGCRHRIDHVHHVRHWAQGGRTDLDNCLGLCWWHHHVVHDGRWGMAGDANGEVAITERRPGGRAMSSRPPDRHHLGSALARLRR